MEKTARRSRKPEILTRAAELIAAHGYDQTSLRDLAESMQISKGTILHHYGSKEQLLERVHAAYMTKRLAEARLILAALATPTQRLAGLIFQLMLIQQSDRAATVAFAREIVRFASDELMDDVRHMRASYTALVTDVIRDGSRQGEFRQQDPNVVALMIFGMCNWSWTWLDPAGRLSPEEIATIFSQTVLDGLRANGASIPIPPQVAEAVHRAIETVAADSSLACKPAND